jgi:lysine-N-methylase
MEEIGQRYAAAHARDYAPFLSANEHMLEHYLVNYVYRTMFPLGPQETRRGPNEHHLEQSIREHCLLMLVQYAMIQTLLIGMAAFHKEEMSPAHAIRAIQSFAKAFDHSVSFPAQALRILGAAEMDTCVKLALTIRH